MVLRTISEQMLVVTGAFNAFTNGIVCTAVPKLL